MAVGKPEQQQPKVPKINNPDSDQSKILYSSVANIVSQHEVTDDGPPLSIFFMTPAKGFGFAEIGTDWATQSSNLDMMDTIEGLEQARSFANELGNLYDKNWVKSTMVQLAEIVGSDFFLASKVKSYIWKVMKAARFIMACFARIPHEGQDVYQSAGVCRKRDPKRAYGQSRTESIPYVEEGKNAFLLRVMGK